MIGRRGFIKIGGAIAAGVLNGVCHASPDANGAENQAPPPPGFLTITYNVLACQGWPQRKSNRTRIEAARAHMPERLGLELALYKPDLVSLAEAPEEEAVARIARVLDMAYVYYPGGFPGALLTRHRIVESANYSFQSVELADNELFSRHCGRALLETPIGEIAVYNAHLNPHRHEIRMREIAAILTTMEDDLDADRSILMQGDLNHKPDQPEYKQWIGAGMLDAFAAKGTGPDGTVTSTTPRARIDYVWLHGPIAGRLTECRTLFEGAFRTNPDDPASFALSDHLPVVANFAR